MENREITKIYRNMKLFENLYAKEIANNGLNANETELLRFIVKHPSQTLNNVAVHLNVDKALVTRMVSKLDKLEYIYIRKSETDKREKNLFPTNKAIELKGIDMLVEEKFYKYIISHALNEDEQKAFYTLLEKVYLESKKQRKMNYSELIK